MRQKRAHAFVTVQALKSFKKCSKGQGLVVEAVIATGTASRIYSQSNAAEQFTKQTLE